MAAPTAARCTKLEPVRIEEPLEPGTLNDDPLVAGIRAEEKRHVERLAGENPSATGAHVARGELASPSK